MASVQTSSALSRFQHDWWPRPLITIVGAALFVRLLMLAFFLKVRPDIFVWNDYECGFIGAALAHGRGFSGGFHDYSAPTSWFAPAYPLVLSVLFRAFGTQTFASAVAAYSFNILCAVITAIMMVKIGVRLCGARTAMLAGLLWALAPQAALPEFILSDTTLATMLMCLAILLTLSLSVESSKPQWLLCGFAWGIAGLASPATLAPLPVFLIYLRKKNPQAGLPAAFLVAAVILALAPWTIRNAVIFHRFIPVRDNGLAEIYFANAGYQENPFGGSMEYQRLGEEKFVRMIEHKLAGYVRTHPIEFVRSSAIRIYRFWTAPDGPFGYAVAVSFAGFVGLLVLLRKSWLNSLPFLAVLGLYPLVYYLSVTFSHYRQPVEPFLYLLLGYALVETVGYITGGSASKQREHAFVVGESR